MPGVTRQLAEFCAASRYGDLPEAVRHEGLRAFVNWFGCVLGGCREPGLATACAVLDAYSGPREATFPGHHRRLDLFAAAFLNGMANSIRGFNDTHLRTVAHPAASVAAAALALAEHQTVRGEAFLHALILGIEIQCRIGNVLVTPPGRSHFGLSMVGMVGGIGAAVAAAQLLGLDLRQTGRAWGIAAGQAGGLRESHGTHASHLLSGEAARAGLMAALLAAQGFTCSDEMIDGDKGFARTYAQDADPAVAVAGLGTAYEILDNTYKPYPCGIVVHPIIDVCLDLVRAHGFASSAIEAVDLTVNPLALQLTGRRNPEDGLRAGSSLYHWAAAALHRGAAGMAEATDACVHDPAIVALRDRIRAVADPGLAADAAGAVVHLTDGTRIAGAVAHARGSAARPLTDDELSAKFLAQAVPVMGPGASEDLLASLWAIEGTADVGRVVQRYFPAAAGAAGTA